MFLYQLAFTMNGVICVFFYFILILYVIDPTQVAPRWYGKNTFEHTIEILLNTVPFLAMAIEYPFN